MNRVHRWTTFALLIVLTGCVDKPVAPRSSAVTLRIQAGIAAQTGPVTSVEVRAGYERTGGSHVQLHAQQVAVASGDQEIAVQIDLSECLDDPERPAPLDVCVLHVDLLLRDANNVVVDSVRTAPVNASSGQIASPARVDLTAGVLLNATFCNDAAPVSWAAFQDGNGDWKRLTIANGAASFRIRTGRGGLAWVRPFGSGFGLSVQYSLISELPGTTISTCTAPAGPLTVSGTVIGLAGPELARIAFGGGGAAALPQSPNFTMQGIVPGTHTLVVARQSIQQTFLRATAVLIRRNIAVQTSAVLDMIDINTATPTESHPLTIVNAGPDAVFTLVGFQPVNQAAIAQIGTVDMSGTWTAVPASLRVAGDLHFLQAAAVASDPSTVRFASEVVATPGARTLTLGPAPGATPFTVISTNPHVRIGTSFSAQPEYAGSYILQASQNVQASPRSASVQMTEGYRQAAGSSALTIPDLRAAAGWDNNWGLQAGTVTNVAAVAQWVTGGSAFQGLVPGSLALSFQRSTTITP